MKNQAIEAVQWLVARNIELEQRVASLEEECSALRAFLRPAAVVPVADVPVREVTGVELEEERE